MLNMKSGPRKLKIRDICYVESSAHNLIYHTLEGEYTILGSLKDAEEKLAAHHVLRCNKGYLVSLRHVDNVQDGCVVVNGQRLLISRPRKTAFMEALTDFLGGGVQ